MLPKPNQADIEEVEGEIKDDQREAATKAALAVTGNQELEEAGADEEAERAFDPIAFLKDLGIEDLDLDFSSFPTVVLNNGKFEVNKVEVGDEFEFIYMDKRTTWLITGEEDRDSDDPDLIYSDDGKTANKDGRPISEWIAEWKDKGWKVGNLSPYVVVMAKQVGGEGDGQIVQLNLPKTSIHPFNGYMVTLGMAKLNPKTQITRAVVGAKLGSGKTTWNPWAFKHVT